MSSTVETLSAYLPRDREMALVAGETLADRTWGTALLADVSGFTALTEALTQALGPRLGAEELTRHLNRVYDTLITEIDRHSGVIISFSGDAITCWYEAALKADQPWEEGLGASAIRAVACGLALQRAMQAIAAVRTPSGRTISLALKVAIASGPARRFVVGDSHQQLIDTLAGATLARMAQAEHAAEKGEVVADVQTVSLLGEALTLRSWRNDDDSQTPFAIVAALAEEALALDNAPRPPSRTSRALSEAEARPWLLPAVYERLREGLGEFLTELRPAEALFLRFEGIDYDADEAGARLDAFIRWVQAVLARYDSAILQLTIGDKGSYLYAAFGAPIAHEDDARRAANAALDLRRPPPECNFIQSIQIGLSGGTMRTGTFGGRTRRTYGVLGDTVNLAARLMQAAAPGEVLASESVHRALSSAFEWAVQPALRVHGKTDLITPVRLVSRRQPVAEAAWHTGRLIGRQAELTQLLDRVAPIFESQFAGLVSVYGEAGVGKSRLLAELRHHLQREGQVSWFICPAEAMPRQSLYPFQRFAQEYFDQYSESSEAGNKARFAEVLQKLIEQVRGRGYPDADLVAHELERTYPFLGALAGGLRWDDSLYERLDPRLRFDNLLVAFQTLISAESLLRPVVLHLEDAHWFDADSLTLVQKLAGSLQAGGRAVAVVLSSRYQDDGRHLPQTLEAGVPHTILDLRDLPREHLPALAQQALNIQAELDPALADLLVAKAGGNPFFIEQFLLDLHERKLLTVPAGRLTLVSTKDEDVLPASLAKVLVARLDRLAAHVKAVVQTAAVLGQEFEVRVLAQMLSDDPHLPEKVQQAERDMIWRALTDLHYIFRHVLLRDAAYTMQLESRLRDLHGLAAWALERTYAAELPQHAADLAYHYRRAQLPERERHFAEMAGQYAAERFANQAAIAHFGRALDLTPAEEHPRQYRLLLARERIYDRLGDRPQQAADLASLAALAEAWDRESSPTAADPEHAAAAPARQAEVALLQASYAERLGDYAAAIAAAQRAVELAQAADSVERYARGCLAWGSALWRRGDYAAARPQLEQALRLAQASNLSAIEAKVLSESGIVARRQGDYGAAVAFSEQALRLLRQLGDRQGESRVFNNLGGIAFAQGDLAQARAYCEQALNLYREVGDRQSECILLNNLSGVMLDSRDYGAAQAYAEQGLRISREINDPEAQGLLLNNLGRIANYCGDFEAARNSLEQALRLRTEIGDRYGQAMVLLSLSLMWHQLNNLERALADGQQALQLAEALGAKPEQVQALLRVAEVLSGAGQAHEAAAMYQQVLERARPLNLHSEVLEALAGLTRLTEPAQAGPLVEEILISVGSDALESTSDPVKIYLTVYEVLRALEDPRGPALLKTAHDQLQVQAQQLTPERQRSFLQNIPSHRALLDEWRRRA